MTVGGPRATPGGEVPEAVLAHYLSRPDVIRQRAQHAAAIAGAAAAALVAVGGIAELYRYPKPIEGLLVAAILAWIGTVAAYMHVVARHVDPVTALEPSGELRPELLNEFENNAADVRASLRLAQRVGQGALALTLLAIAVTAWHAEAMDESVLSRVVVSDGLAAAVGTACGASSALGDGTLDFRAEIRLDDLKAPFIELQVRDARCRHGESQVKMRVPTDGILAAAPVED